VQRDCTGHAIAHDCAVHAPRQRPHVIRLGQAQPRLDLLRQLVAKIEKPAAGERLDALFLGGAAFGAPPRIQGRQKLALVCRSRRGLEPPVRLQQQALARQSQQHVVTAEVRRPSDAFEQHGVTVGVPLVKSQQRVVVEERRLAPHCRARNTRLPLVPPKPNEFDSATCTGATRAVPGT